MKNIAQQIFFGLLIEFIILYVAYIFRKNPKATIFIIFLGTLIAGFVAFYPMEIILGNKSQIVFVSDRDGGQEIYAMNSEGTEQKRLTFGGENKGHPAWSSDRKQIAFDSVADGEISQIFLMDSDGTNLSTLISDNFFKGNPVWSPDNQKLLFFKVLPDDNLDIFLINTSNSLVSQIRVVPE